MTILKFILNWTIVPFFKLLVTIFAVGCIRLLCASWKQYENSIKDISVLKKGDIILTGKQTILDSWYIQLSNVLTRKLKHRFWTHAAIYQGNGKVWEAQPEGIIEKDMKVYIDGGYLIRAFRHKNIQENEIFDRVIQFCAEKKGYHYGIVGLIFYVFSTLIPVSFNWIFDNRYVDRLCNLDNAYFCSELIVDAYCSVGQPISPYDGWRVKPSDFISNPVLEAVIP